MALLRDRLFLQRSHAVPQGCRSWGGRLPYSITMSFHRTRSPRHVRTRHLDPRPGHPRLHAAWCREPGNDAIGSKEGHRCGEATIAPVRESRSCESRHTCRLAPAERERHSGRYAAGARCSRASQVCRQTRRPWSSNGAMVSPLGSQRLQYDLGERSTPSGWGKVEIITAAAPIDHRPGSQQPCVPMRVALPTSAGTWTQIRRWA
jgi:hypothetical protein